MKKKNLLYLIIILFTWDEIQGSNNLPFPKQEKTLIFQEADFRKSTADILKQLEEEQKKREEEARREAEMKALAQALLQKQEEEKTTLIAIQNNKLILLSNTEERTATAIFQIPSYSQIYSLTQEEVEQAKKNFKVYASETRGQHKIIHFSYTDKNLLPQTMEQAVFLLYSPYLKQNANSFPDIPPKPCPLNEAQKKVIYPNGIQNPNQQHLKLAQLTSALANKVSKKEGFIGTTRVKTEKGYIRLEELKVGDTVICYDAQKKEKISSPITYYDKIKLTEHVQLTVNNEVIRVAPNHQFYIPSTEAWVSAQDFVEYPTLQNLVGAAIQKAEKVAEPLEVIRIAVGKNHNFYITDHDILVHNYIPVVFELGALWGGAEAATITYAILAPTAIAIGQYLITHVFHKAAHTNTNTNKQPALHCFDEAWEKAASNPKQEASFGQQSTKPNSLVFEPANTRINDQHLTKNTSADKDEAKGSKETNAQAPGKPTEKDGFIPPKKWDGEKVRHPKTGQYGYPDKNGKVWVPTGVGPRAHGGPHWDVIDPQGKHKNILPGGKER